MASLKVLAQEPAVLTALQAERCNREEQKMGDFLSHHLPKITRQYMRSRAS